MKKRVSVAMCLITDPLGHVLMALRRPHQTRPNMWELPGGRIERGETQAQAVAREAIEELGCTVSVGPRLAATNLHLEVNFTLYLYAATIIIGKPAPLESVKLRWVDIRRAIVSKPCVPSTYLFYPAICHHLGQER